MILTVTLNPALDKFYWLEHLPESLAPSEEGVTIRTTKSLTSAGGKGINVSVFLAAHDIDTVAMGFLGGHTGQVILRDLLARGVSTNFVWIDEENRTNVALIVRGHEYCPIHIHEEGPPIPAEALRIFLRKYERMLLRASYVVLAGALPPGIPLDFYQDLARRAREKGVRVVVHAGGEPMLRSLAERPFLVKPDVREGLRFGDLPLHTEEGVIAAGRRAIAQGAEICLISHQLTGDILVSAEGIWKFEAKTPLSAFRNLVGADDALVGGVLVGLHQGADLIESVKYGMAAAVASAEVEEKLCLDRKKILAELEKVEVRRREGS
ncbi:MAG: 1-phosphofructokinase family hexose kinase [Candidatus Bipolaricaulota bacterium]|nr:1-phosphofructokinase family hexose kinase [Candidatus Bipolaricaulota bacterium]MDW8126214.1 1-phosphofructokinase family hexose kinase [Candidatus Bipolaricaulota bacterium]